MVILRKIKGSTIMETLVATVLIVVIFMLSSMILNNLFSNTLKNNTRSIMSHLNELEYLHYNGKLALPHLDEHNGWDVSVTNDKHKGIAIIVFSATDPLTDKTVETIIYDR